jgi:hypothetical protein
MVKNLLLFFLVWISCYYFCSQPQPPYQGSDIPFEQIILENTVGRHPNVADMNDDGKNDIIIVTDYVDDQGKDATNLKKIVIYEAPDWTKRVIAELNYRACDMEVADMDGDNDFDVVGRASRYANQDEEEALNFWLENPGPDNYFLNSPWKRHDVGPSVYVKNIEIGDFNRDSKPDIVARTDHHIYLWLQENFDTWNLKQFEIHPHEGMRIGDLDDDGDPDIVLNGFWLETPEKPLSNDFVEHTISEKWYTQNTGKWMDNSCRIFIADINNDKRQDVLFSQSEMPGFPVCWYEAPPNPRNEKWLEHVIGQVDYCHTLVAEDMDGDGDVVAGELIHGTDPDPESAHPVVVFVNEGQGLTWRKQELSDQGTYGAETGDLDDDGDQDIIGSRNFRDPPLFIWFNKTSDLMAEKVPFVQKIVIKDTVNNSNFVGIGDLNNDKNPDLLVFTSGKTGKMSWYNYPDFEEHLILEGPYHAERPSTADIDLDNDLDIFVSKNNGKEAVWVENPFTNEKSKNSWTEHFIGKPDVRVKDYGVADFDQDGKLDLVFAGYEGTCIFFQDDVDHWSKNEFEYENGHEGADIGDLDGDGDPDIVLNGRWFETPAEPRTGPFTEHEIDKKWFNQTGTWQQNSTMIKVADIDGNGKNDVVISHSEWPGYPVAWYSCDDPRGGKWEEHIVEQDFGWCETLDVGDVDLDGDLDILAARFERAVEREYDYWLSERPYAIRIYFNEDGKGERWKMQQVSTFGMYYGHLVDIGNDGDLDIVGPRSYWRGPISIWENKLK